MNTEVTEKKRFFTEINVARGIAVLLVLLGHSFPDSQTGITSPVAKSIFNFVYAFHTVAYNGCDYPYFFHIMLQDQNHTEDTLGGFPS